MTDTTQITATTTIDLGSVFLCLVASLPLCLWVFRSHCQKQGNDRSVPDAIGGAPLLGNALQYKESPTAFIRNQERLTDSKVFRVNMAGRRLVVIGSDTETGKLIANQPESILSSKRAVAEIGFEYTLGSFNVYKGTDWHKEILKNFIMGENFERTFLPTFSTALLKSVDHETKLPPIKSEDGFAEFPDLFHWVRRCILRAILDSFVSPLLLEKDPDILTEFIVFQDKIEDATAKAAVIPRAAALPICLWPTQRARKILEGRLSRLLTDVWKYGDGDDKSREVLGPWMQAYISEKATPELAAEHLIGLVFAAHKNPSIGASQCLCFLRNDLSEKQQALATEEARKLHTQIQSASSENKTIVAALLEAKTLRSCVLETSRVTAHTLGALRYAEQSLEIQAATTASPSTKRSLVIQQGETIAVAHHTTHMEPSLWGKNASKFFLDRPEWKDDNAKLGLAVPVDQYKFTSFSNGVHKCPGERVALAMMEMMLGLLLLRDAKFVGEIPPISFERATLAQRAGPCAFRLNR